MSLRFWFVASLSMAYVVVVTGYFILRHYFPCWPPIAWINNAVPFLFVPLPFVIAVALLSRSGVIIAGSLVVLVLFVLLYGALFFPRLQSVIDPDDRGLKALTFNLKFDQPHPEQAVGAIEEANADIVTVQELTTHTVDLLRTDLGQLYPYTILDPSKGGVGLLSRFPIQSSEWFFPGGDGQGALHATLDIDGTTVHILAVHPLPPRFTWSGNVPRQTFLPCAEREQQMAVIAGRAAVLEGPLLVMGDFNMSDQTQAYARLGGVLQDAYREAGWGFGFTFPLGKSVGPIAAPGPLTRIDYIFYSGELYAERASVGCTGGSDHCYVVAEFSGLP